MESLGGFLPYTQDSLFLARLLEGYVQSACVEADKTLEFGRLDDILICA